jgi:putative oxidoreductase
MKIFPVDGLNKYQHIGLLILRVGLGIMFVYHGAPKLFGGPEMWSKVGMNAGNFGLSFLPTFWGFMASVAEFGGGLCLIAGFLFMPACALLVIDLIVASSYHFNAGQGLAMASHAIEDAIMFLGLIFIGPGKYSLDYLLFSKKSEKE